MAARFEDIIKKPYIIFDVGKILFVILLNRVRYQHGHIKPSIPHKHWILINFI